MANLKVFVSSTCYDLQSIRSQLKSMLVGFGYEPVMSDQADVIYDPRIHTHTSCLREVENCDVTVLIIGSRFGGTTIPKALELIDIDRIKDAGTSGKFADDKSKISITQAEVLYAIEIGLPIFAFIDSGVMRDHLTYEKNKNKSIINQIDFSSIEKSETAPYIFEFINFLRLRNENNSIFEFSRFEDINEQLKKQWSGLFQRLLHEQRGRSVESRRIDNLSSQIADLKAAILGSISSSELKETAKGAIRFRMMVDFIYSIAKEHGTSIAFTILHSDLTWSNLLTTLDITDIKTDNSNRLGIPGIILIRKDETYYRAKISIRFLSKIELEWYEFQKLGKESKDAILNAVLDSRADRQIPLVRHYNELFTEENPLVGSDDSDIGLSNIKSVSSPHNRILLTADKFIEETIQNFLISQPNCDDMRFMVNATENTLELKVLSSALKGPIKSFTHKYVIPESGSLTEIVSELKVAIQKYLNTLAIQPEKNMRKKVKKAN